MLHNNRGQFEYIVYSTLLIAIALVVLVVVGAVVITALPYVIGLLITVGIFYAIGQGSVLTGIIRVIVLAIGIFLLGAFAGFLIETFNL